MNLNGKSLIVALSILASMQAQADDGAKNRDYLIEKLNKVYLTLAPMDNSRVAVTLRLADLLAERARVASMEELDSGCVTCVAGAADRKKALSLYNEVLEKVPAASKGKVMVQMGHLHQLLGNDAVAITTYNKIAADAIDPVAKAEAYLSIAEINYKKNNWAEAQKNYELVLATPNASSRGFAAYRRAWSLFNQGQIAKAKTALNEILKNPALLSKTGSATNQIDPGFHEEVAADYATFAGREFASGDLEAVFTLSPEKTKINNITTVAAELERTGKKADALKAWEHVYQYQSLPQERIQTQAHLAALYLDNGQKEKAYDTFAAVFSLAAQLKAQFPKEVEEARKVIKVSIVTWNQADKKAPTVELLSAYEGYLGSFGFEKEMNQWAVQLAGDLNQWERAWKLHQVASGTLVDKELENHLLLGIELGEKSKDNVILSMAQNEYLTKSPLKTKQWEVRYQQAYRFYEADQMKDALPLLKALALNEAAPMDLRTKASDLSLDILASMKDDAAIEVAAVEFHNSFVKSKQYNSAGSNLQALSQKSILNQVASLAAVSADQAWTALQRFKMSAADEKDKAVYLKNKMALAEKRGDLAAALSAAQDLTLLSSASAEDKAMATAKTAHYMDLRMDFKGAMAATQVLPENILAADKKALKLALYAELTGASSAPYLKKFIEVSKSEDEKAVAAAELVKNSPQFEVELKKQWNSLLRNPEVLASMMLDKYVETPSASLVQMVEKEEKLKKTVAGKLILKDDLIKQMLASSVKIESHKMDAANQKLMVKSIKDRAKLLEDFEKLAAKAISSGDWTSQVVGLTVVAKEADRFYNEILSLPLPEGLSDAEQSEYMSLLGQQSAPYRNKSDMAAAKVKEFWSSSWKESLQAASVVEFRLKSLFEAEVQALTAVAPADDKAFLTALKPSTVQQAKPSLVELEAARNALRAQPMDKVAAEKLKDLEMKAGNKAMVQYLEGRMANMSAETSQKGVQ